MTLTKKDYCLVAFIGFCFGLFSIPVLKNIDIGINLNALFIVGIMAVSAIFAVLALWLAGIIAKKIPIILQIAKFAAVGTFNTLLDAGVLNLLIYLTSIATGLGFVVFKGISFIIANIASYFWNHHWTFEVGNKTSTKEFGKFFGVSVIGFLINIGAASLVVNVIGAPAGTSPEIWANVGFITATLASLVWNFVGYKFFVFVTKKSARKLDSGNM
jgi:putative flippase GtrA